MKRHKVPTTLFMLPPYAWLIVFLLLPMAIVIIMSLSHYDPAHVPPVKLAIISKTAPVLENFAWIFQDDLYVRAYSRSFKLAAQTTLITLLIGYPLALAIAKSSKKMRLPLLLAVILPFWTSLIIRIYAITSLLSEVGPLNKALIGLGLISAPIRALNSEIAVVVGMSYCYLPFMILPLYIAIERIDSSILEASLDLGCTPIRRFFQIILPMSKSGIIAGSLLVFMPAMGEVIIPDILGGGKVMTVGKIIWNEFFSNRDWPVASALTTVLVFTFVIPIIVIQNKFLKDGDFDDK